MGYHVDRMSAAVCNPSDDELKLDAEVLFLDSLLAPVSLGDKKHEERWAALEARQFDPKQDDPETFALERRLAEFKLLIICAYQNNLLRKAAVPFDDSEV